MSNSLRFFGSVKPLLCQVIAHDVLCSLRLTGLGPVADVAGDSSHWRKRRFRGARACRVPAAWQPFIFEAWGLIKISELPKDGDRKIGTKDRYVDRPTSLGKIDPQIFPESAYRSLPQKRSRTLLSHFLLSMHTGAMAYWVESEKCKTRSAR